MFRFCRAVLNFSLWCFLSTSIYCYNH